MKTLAFGAVTAGIGFIYGKLHGKDHAWRRYGYATTPGRPDNRQR